MARRRPLDPPLDPPLARALETALAEARRAQALATALGPASDHRERLVAAVALTHSRQALERMQGEVGRRLGQLRRSRAPLAAYSRAATLPRPKR